MSKTSVSLISLLFLCSLALNAQKKSPSPEVLIRCDDMGMSHAVNMAIKEVAESGLPFSTSVMVACPWFPEAVEILKQFPHVSVGIHLMLNSEWKGLRWGPVLGAAAVPSLVDSFGYFFPSRASLMANGPKLDEVERELRAQIQRALAAGLKPDYLDHHMGAAVGTPEMRAIVEKLAAEFNLVISRYFEEQDAAGVYRAAVPYKTDTLVAVVKRLGSGRHLLVFHTGLETPEMDALIDQNTIGLPDVSKHRNAERKALLAKEFHALIHARDIRLLTYRDLLHSEGTARMKRPVPN